MSEIDFSTPKKRKSIYLLLECTDGVKGANLIKVENLLSQYLAKLRNEPYATGLVSLSLIAYSTYAQQLVPLTPLSDFKLPKLTTGGIHNLGNALCFLGDCVDRDLVRYTGAGKYDCIDYPADMIWITVSKPSDDWRKGLAYWKKHIGSYHGETRIWAHFENGDQAHLDILTSVGFQLFRLEDINHETLNWMSSRAIVTHSIPTIPIVRGPLPSPPKDFRVVL